MRIKYFGLLFILLTAAPAVSQNHQGHTASSDTIKGSPKKIVMAGIGQVDVHIEYSSPAVRKRIIWKGLVPYDAVWVTGAHQATWMSFSSDITIAGTRLHSGKYAFFTIPGETEWTLILNKNWKQHLADDYDQKDDVLRWKVKPETGTYSERLTYRVLTDSDKTGTVEISWENLKVSFQISD